MAVVNRLKIFLLHQWRDEVIEFALSPIYIFEELVKICRVGLAPPNPACPERVADESKGLPSNACPCTS